MIRDKDDLCGDKNLLHQEDRIILCTLKKNPKPYKYIKHKLTEQLEEINKSTIKVEEFDIIFGYW